MNLINNGLHKINDHIEQFSVFVEQSLSCNPLFKQDFYHKEQQAIVKLR